MEKHLESKDIYNDKGKRIATVHGRLDIKMIANFFLKTPIRNVKGH